MNRKLLTLLPALALAACATNDPYVFGEQRGETYEEGVVIVDRDRDRCYDRNRDGIISSSECADYRSDDRYDPRDDRYDPRYDRDVVRNADDDLRRDVTQQLSRQNLHEVQVRVEDRDVYLSGWVNSSRDRDLAYDVARRTSGVDDVYFRDLRVG